MSEGKISVTFEQDHDRLDALFTTFQEQKRKDFAKAKEAFVAFKFGLQRHIVWEEDVLFPKWEENSGMAEGGPTQVMRTEHRMIGDCLEAIHERCRHRIRRATEDEQRLVGYSEIAQHEGRADSLPLDRSGDQ
jgi:regulator of cell morphogenesis and NO signaling